MNMFLKALSLYLYTCVYTCVSPSFWGSVSGVLGIVDALAHFCSAHACRQCPGKRWQMIRKSSRVLMLLLFFFWELPTKSTRALHNELQSCREEGFVVINISHYYVPTCLWAARWLIVLYSKLAENVIQKTKMSSIIARNLFVSCTSHPLYATSQLTVFFKLSTCYRVRFREMIKTSASSRFPNPHSCKDIYLAKLPSHRTRISFICLEQTVVLIT